MIEPVKITVHHSGGVNDTFNGLVRWWQTDKYQSLWENGFPFIPYHTLIDKDGIVHKGRQDYLPGEHVRNDNKGNLGICLIGNYLEENPSDIAVKMLINEIRALIIKYPKVWSVEPHCNRWDTLCPGPFLANIISTQFGNLIEKGYKEVLTS